MSVQPHPACDQKAYKAAVDAYDQEFNGITNTFRKQAEWLQCQSSTLMQELKNEDNTLLNPQAKVDLWRKYGTIQLQYEIARFYFLQAEKNWERCRDQRPVNPCIMQERNDIYKKHWQCFNDMSDLVLDNAHDHEANVYEGAVGG